MKYTKEQLQAMSDFEVNKALCALFGRDVSGICELRNQTTGAVTDFCNTANDIMPLAFEYAIGVEVNPIRTEWLARTCDISMSNMNFRCYVDKNPLRAIACCLILVLQERDA